MKAASLNSNSTISLIEKPKPDIKEDECLVRVSYCGICSSDIYRAYDNGAYFYPLIMGHEFSGVIEKIGKSVSSFRTGDLVGVFPLLPCFKCASCKKKEYVTCSDYKYYGSRNDGGFSEYVAVKDWNLFKIEHNLDPKDISLLEPLSVVVHSLKQAKIYNKTNFERDSVCIIGCGFLGLILSEIILKKYNFKEISIVDRNNFKLDKITSKDNVVKSKINSEDEWASFIKKNKSQFDYTFEMSGNSQNFVRSIHLAKPRSKIVLLGNIDDNLFVPRETISSVIRKELNIIGTWNSNFKNKNDDWKDSYELIKQKILKPSKFVTKAITIEEIQKITKKMYNHKIGIKRHEYIKYIVAISNDR